MSFFFFFNDTATTEIYTLSLHDALPIARLGGVPGGPRHLGVRLRPPGDGRTLAVPRRVHLPVLRCGRHARAGRVLARAPGACPGRGRRVHGWEGPARGPRPAGGWGFSA